MKPVDYANLKFEYEDLVMELMHRAKKFQMDSAQIHLEFSNLKDSLPENTPYSLKEYLSGMYRCAINMFYENDLEFCYWVNGGKYSSHKDSDTYYGKFDINPSALFNMPHGNYWKNSDKLFFMDSENMDKLINQVKIKEEN